MEFLLQMSNVSKTYPGVKALDDVQIAIKPGEVHALIGENGAGKSTLMKILVGVESADEGVEIFFAGEKVHFSKPIDATLKGISIIYQDLSLFPNLSVAENICIGRESAGKGYYRVQWKQMKLLAEKTLAELGLKMDVSLPLGKLSIAKQQLVAIARSLVFDSKLIVMDEPTSSLSSGEVEQLYKIIEDLRMKGISIIYISHKLKELFTVADRFTVLRDGKFVGSYDKNDMNEDKLISLMVGRKVEVFNREENKGGEEVLRVEGLSKRGNFKDISFSLRAGEIIGITGLVGAGRTELAHALFGLNKPDHGHIYISGKKVDIKSSSDAVKHKMAYIPESRQTQGLFLRQSIIDNISVTVFDQMLNKFGFIERAKEKQLAAEYIQILDIRPPLAEMNAGQLSGGNQQKIVIAKWLSTNPKILIIDEPTNGIDIGAKTEIHKLLRRLTNKGIGIIVISSELPEVLAVSDRILVMKQGRISGEIAGAEATQEKIMNFAVLGDGLN
ncbi:ribose import ATP-binding protein RbsA [Paenibacillus baekrokdamisoli]|uniref:Autoinducer 2 import ATP-binding protein LsrA n=1 Tax=Paenibacillus baekrokdamisoli TaxID=1712516 RepID=A0A3G9J7R5_9BACL|nr:sugar ABC transporter ATP-binding protein [Paenibacillus baekrokdamisoli]MBB3067789.1 ABC-type sugar transport system ATPase subunit [Paenibacillus baekrokdamisoli]BBH19029.1 ribose import ATP-binding protein RbsA [Paenibacillus baekrokdamisoli]